MHYKYWLSVPIYSFKHKYIALNRQYLLPILFRPQLSEMFQLKFRGSHLNPENSVKSFYHEGLYMEIMEELDDWEEVELGDLLVGTTKVS